ncbi:MAG: hypothetical protein N3C60_00535 [Calditerrivibrio sp.]|nr:hypothetical protein [Calditerrivibrio sp.]
MINGVRLGDLIKFSLDPNSIELKEGEKIPVNVIKEIKNGLFLVNIKGRSFTAYFQNLPQIGRFIAEVVKTEPILELKMQKEAIPDEQIKQVKGEVLSFDKKETRDILYKSGISMDVKNITPEKVKDLIRNSGIFFENKLHTGEQIQDDIKYQWHQKGDTESTAQISKLQLITFLSGLDAYLPIKSDDEDVDDFDIIIKKGKTVSIMIRTHFSKLGDTLIYIRDIGNGLIDCVIKTEADISDDLKEVMIPNVRVSWSKITKVELESFNPQKEALNNLGGWEVVV